MYTHRTEGMQIAWMVAGGFVGVGLVLPFLLKPLFFAWMALARLLSIVNTHLLLALIFYTLLRSLAALCAYCATILLIASDLLLMQRIGIAVKSLSSIASTMSGSSDRALILCYSLYISYLLSQC